MSFLAMAMAVHLTSANLMSTGTSALCQSYSAALHNRKHENPQLVLRVPGEDSRLVLMAVPGESSWMLLAVGHAGNKVVACTVAEGHEGKK